MVGFFFFFQAEDGIRDHCVTGVQTCALPIFDDGKTTPFAEVPAEDSITTNLIGLLPDGKTLYWIDSRGRDKAALVAQDLASGKTKVLAESAKGDIADVMVNPVTQVAEAYEVNYLRNEWLPLGNAVKADIDRKSVV